MLEKILGSFGTGLAGYVPSFLSGLYFYNEQKEYNNPSAQKERLLSAGLSPAAASQAIAGVPSLAPNTPSVSNSGGASDYIALSQLQLQKDLIASEIHKNDAETSNIESQTNRILQLTPIEVQKMSQDIKESISREHLNGANKVLAEVTSERIQKMTPLELEQLEQLIKKTKSEINLNRQSLRNMEADYHRINATTNLLNKQSLDTQLSALLKQNTLNLAQILNVDPHSPWMVQIAQNLAQGDTSALDSILNSILKITGNMFGMAVDAGKKVASYLTN